MCDCDWDPPSIYNESEPTAKKEHRCSECRRMIEAGEKYTRVEGCWDGDWYTFKTCRHCSAAIETIKAVKGCFCPSLGHAIEQFNDDGHDEDEGSLPTRMYHSMRRKWRYRRGPHKGKLMPVPVVPERKAVTA